MRYVKFLLIGLGLSMISFVTPDKLNWFNTFEEAKTIASKEDKLILLVFSGSDWCRNCILLDQEVFTDIEFEQLAEKDLILLKADFPRKRKNQLSSEQQANNSELAKEFNSEGAFPKVLLMDVNKQVYLTTGYQQGQKSKFLNNLRSKI